MPKTPQRTRALMYVSGTSEEVDQQLAILGEVCARRGYDMAGIVLDPPDGVQGYHDAHRMLAAGDADLILFASVTVLPSVLESATGSVSTTRVREIIRSEARRRTRPMPRPRRGGAA